MAQRLSISNKQKVLFGAGIFLGLTGLGIGIYQSRKRKKKEPRQKAARQTKKKQQV